MSEEIKFFVKLLSPLRALHDSSRLQIAQCLFDIDSNLLDVWLSFNKKCNKNYNKNDCINEWNSMTYNNHNLNTLSFFAEKDSPIKFSKNQKDKLEKLIKYPELTHYKMAKIFQEKYYNRFRCVSIVDKLWVEYIGSEWVTINEHKIRILISTELVSVFSDRQMVLFNLAKQQQGYDKEQSINEAMCINKIIQRLEDNNFKKGIISEYADLAYDPTCLGLEDYMY